MASPSRSHPVPRPRRRSCVDACAVHRLEPRVLLASALPTPLGAGALMAPAAAVAARNGAIYVARAVTVMVSSGIGGFVSFEEECFNYALNNKIPRFSPFFVPKIICDIGAGYISIRHGLRGPNFAVVSACASSNNSIIEALYHLRLNKADAILCGGSEAGVAHLRRSPGAPARHAAYAPIRRRSCARWRAASTSRARS